MSSNTQDARRQRVVNLRLGLFVAVLVAAFVVGMAVSAAADLRLPTSDLGTPPIVVQRIVATPDFPPAATPAPSRPAPAPLRPRSPGGRCGGDLPPCSVMACESGGDIRVRNRGGSSASGKWQVIRSTWNGYGGYAEARDAPEHVQDAKARELWAGGAGRGHWRECL